MIDDDPLDRPPLALPDRPLGTDGPPPIALRPWGAAPTDAAALAEAWADAVVARWTRVPGARTVDDAARWIAGEADRRDRGLAVDLVVADPEHLDGVLGEVGLVVVEQARRWAEVGYWLTEPARGEGRATAALALLSGWALDELPLRRLFARTDADNPASAAVARGAGYELAGEAGPGTQVWVRDRAGA